MTEPTDQTVRNFIDGELVASATTDFIDLVDPVTGEPDGRSPISTHEEVDRAYAAAERASTTWKRLTPGARQAYLLDLATAIAGRRDEISAVQARDTGQPVRYIASEEVDQGVDQLRFFAGAARLLEGKSSGEYLEGHTSAIRREPIGVVGQVTPWNYPFAMAIWKVAPALAAGNTVVLKPSDTTPRSTVLLAEIAGGVLPPGVLNVVNGDASTGRYLVEHPTPGLVAITGSVRAGTEVALSAAKSLKRVHLELGGKAPVVVMPDADLPRAAEMIAAAAYFNAGQDCTAATRVIAHSSVHDELADLLVKAAEGTLPGAPSDEEAEYGPLNNAATSRRSRRSSRSCPTTRPSAPGGAGTARRGSSSPRPSSPAYARTTASCRRRSSDRCSPCSPSTTRPTRWRWPTACPTDSLPACGPATSASPTGSPASSTSGACGSTPTSRSSRRCRTAASAPPATARTCRATASTTTRASST